MWHELEDFLREQAKYVNWDRKLEFAKEGSGAAESLRNHFIDYGNHRLKWVSELVERLPEFQPYIGSSARLTPSSGLGQAPRELASWLIAQSKMHNVADVLSTFRHFLKENRCEILEVCALWGINPKRSVQITSEVELCEISNIPLSYYRDYFSGMVQSTIPVDLNLTPWRATAVLWRRAIVEPVIFVGTKWPPPGATPTSYDDGTLQAIARCLPAFFDRSVCALASWGQGDIRTPLVGRDSGCGSIGYEHCFHQPIDKSDIDTERLVPFVRKYLALGDLHRERMDAALERLNRCWRITDTRQKAIDARVLLEMLLWSEDDPNDNISYRLKQRGCLLLGGEGEQRKLNYELVGKIYSIGSQAVHGSPAFKANEKTWRLLDEALRFCGALIREIINLGEFPNWKRRICGF